LKLASEILGNAGRLLLEYNESTAEIHRTLEATNQALTAEKCDVVVSYGGEAVSLAGDGSLLMPVRDPRYNAALETRARLGQYADGIDLVPELSSVLMLILKVGISRFLRPRAAG